MKLVWIAVLAAALSLISLAYTMHTRANDQSRLERVAKETHAALCTFKHDLEQRYMDGAAFLERHPEGISGISAADIQRSLANQKATLASLRALDCS